MKQIAATWLIFFSLIASLSCINAASAGSVEFKNLPNSAALPAEVQKKIQETWLSTPSDYDPRSKHLREDGSPIYANRLLLSLSPYLRQHAHTPVDWFPWSEEAFSEAKARGVPIFLSIGYSSCHWCHVMEEESFDSIEIAKVLNQNFVAIKVDRETNPEVDEIHLLALQVLGLPGGWPLNMFLTSDGHPFMGVTYLSEQQLATALAEVSYFWKTQKQQALEFGKQVSEMVQQFGLSSDQHIEIGQQQVEEFISHVHEELKSRDEFAPNSNRFPSEAELFLLLDAAVRYENSDAVFTALARLDGMARGGIRDHVGGGFHRYTVDNEWLIPHFEKMLYNQALISRSFLYAYELTGTALYRRVATQTLDYILREMKDEFGSFYSATDADSGGLEGEFFLWTLDDIRQSAPEHSDFVIQHYGVTEEGNFEGKNILNITATPESRATDQGIDIQEYLRRLEESTKAMREYRDLREKPFLDRKTITAWNGLMITTLSEASRILSDVRYLEAAQKAAEFIWSHSLDKNGQLYRIYLDGVVTEKGKLRDYAYFIQAMLSLYDQTTEPIWLERSESLTEKMFELFWDDKKGGFFLTASNDTDQLFSRFKDRFDEALPSGNSVAALSLSRLHYRTGQEVYASRLQQLVQAFAAEISKYPTSFPYLLAANDDLQNGSIGPREFAASGNAKVSVKQYSGQSSNYQILVELDLADGWHVQSDTPASSNLFATIVDVSNQGWKIEDIEYPAEEFIYASFQSAPLSVWSNQVTIPITLQKVGSTTWGPVLEVRLQACDDSLCLLPESVKLEVPQSLLMD